MKKSCFVVSKPLQYINATNITDDTPKVCVFINNMANGLGVFNELKKKSNHWAELLYFETRMDALKYLIQQQHQIENLYLDSDYGFVIQHQLSKIKANIFVYEEGLGTYRKSLRKKSLLNQVISLVNVFKGNHDYMGGYRQTKGVYIYDEAKHRNDIAGFEKPRHKFDRTFVAHLKHLPEIDVFFPEQVRERLHYLKSKKVVIYLMKWKINDLALEMLKTYKDHLKILKPHPNLKDIKEFRGIDEFIDSYILVELVLLYLVENCEEVIVFHEGSSFTMYIGSHKNLKLINVNKHFPACHAT